MNASTFTARVVASTGADVAAALSGAVGALELGSPRFQAAEALEKAALAELHARRPDRVLATNVEFWSAVVLDLAEVPPDLRCSSKRVSASGIPSRPVFSAS